VDQKWREKIVNNAESFREEASSMSNDKKGNVKQSGQQGGGGQQGGQQNRIARLCSVEFEIARHFRRGIFCFAWPSAWPAIKG